MEGEEEPWGIDWLQPISFVGWFVCFLRKRERKGQVSNWTEMKNKEAKMDNSSTYNCMSIRVYWVWIITYMSLFFMFSQIME